MTEPQKPMSKKQIFQQVKQLCMQGNFTPSRHLICQAAGLDISDPMKISRNDIRAQTNNPLVRGMLNIEEAFVSLRHAFSAEEPNEYDVGAAAYHLENILPLMTNNQEKLYVRYWIGNCHSYMPDVLPEQRLENIKEIVNLAPKGKNDSLLYSYSLLVCDLNVPAADKYYTIKKAYQKTNKSGYLPQNYKEMLGKVGFNYYQVLYNTAANKNASYEQRCDAVYEAVEVIKDLNYSMSHKCRARIELLDKLERLQQGEHDFKGIGKTARLRQKYVNHLNNIGRLFPNRKDEHLYR